MHQGGIVDIPFPRPGRDALLAEGLAEEHRWVPNSGRITFHVRGEELAGFDMGSGSLGWRVARTACLLYSPRPKHRAIPRFHRSPDRKGRDRWFTGSCFLRLP